MKMINSKFPALWFGGDYNPDQWPEEVWQEDLRLMKIYHVNAVTLPVFSWANLQPDEDTFCFEWLDKVIDSLYGSNIKVILATPTAAQPAWMSKKYPEILPVTIHGLRRKHGARNNFCPNSSDYRRLSGKIAGEMAKRYGNHPALVMWHVNNEYGTYCYCDNCARKFREWLRERYGTMDELNRRWYTNFWGHTYYSWDEIEVPSYLTEHIPKGLGDRDASFMQSLSVDYNRFMSESIMECYKNEADAIRAYSPDVPITTNIMSPFKPLDLFTWGEHLDVVSWDNYPSNEGITDKDLMSIMAMKHDLMRGIRCGKPFLLMEQTPSQQNWLSYNAQKRPGIMRLWSYQTIAHGADGIMFFQWRQSKSGFEKFHAAMVPHSGNENSRTAREVIKLGEELERLGESIPGSTIKTRVAIMFDWPNWWAMEYSSGPTIDLKYLQQVSKYYKAFHRMNVPVDMIRQTDNLSGYDIVVAPVMYMVKDGVPENIKEFIKKGGTFITTYFSGIVDENDQVILGGYPGAFRDFMGICVEEVDALLPGQFNEVVTEKGHIYKCDLICEVIRLEGAKPVASYTRDYYAGYPCITENVYYNGRAVYIGTSVEDELISDLFSRYCSLHGIKPLLNAPAGVEVTVRSKENCNYFFILNHNDHDVTVEIDENDYTDLLSGNIINGRIDLKSRDVAILKRVSSGSLLK